jgi:acyl-CoA thioester hydrolase
MADLSLQASSRATDERETIVSETSGDFRFRHPVEVRFKDVDVGGHAHHSHALVYFEEARWAYWRAVIGELGAADVGYILAEACVRYHQRVFWPARLDVGVRVTLLGSKHFEMSYEVRSPSGERLISGSTTQVWYDYVAKRSARIPDPVRAALEAQDGPFRGVRERRGSASGSAS